MPWLVYHHHLVHQLPGLLDGLPVDLQPRRGHRGGEGPMDPGQQVVGEVARPPLGIHGGSVSAEQTSQSSGFWFMILKIRGTSSLVNADDVVDPKTQARFSGDHLVNADDVVDTKTQAKLAPPHSPTPRLGRMVMLVPCLNSSFEFILVSGFRCEIRTPSLAFLL